MKLKTLALAAALAVAPFAANAITFGTVGSTTLDTTFVAPNLTQYIQFAWDGSSAGAGFDFSVSAVPVPAGALLLGTALVGLGFARSRKTA